MIDVPDILIFSSLNSSTSILEEQWLVTQPFTYLRLGRVLAIGLSIHLRQELGVDLLKNGLSICTNIAS